MGLTLKKVQMGKSLQIQVTGCLIKSYIAYLCDKLLNFDKYLSPSKKILIATDQPFYEEKVNVKFTECDIIDHAIMFWPN